MSQLFAGINRNVTNFNETQMGEVLGQGIFNVKAYGAMGTGSVNDANAIQNAIDAAEAVGGGIVFIPSGIYKVDTSGGAISIPHLVTVRGDLNAVIDHTAGSVLFACDSGILTGVIRDLKITGGVSGGVGIKVSRPRKILDNIIFKDYIGTCIYLYYDGELGPWLSRLSNINVDGFNTYNAETTDYGIRANNQCNSVIISNFEIAGCKEAGIEILGGDGITIRDGAFEHCAYDADSKALKLGEAATANNIRVVGLSGLYFEDNMHGIYMERGEAVTIENVFCLGTGMTNGIYMSSDIIGGRITCVTLRNCKLYGATSDLQMINVADTIVDNCYIYTITTSEIFTWIGNDTSGNSHLVTGNLKHDGTELGFYGTASKTKQTVTGSKGANAALTSLLSALATLGLVTDSTT